MKKWILKILVILALAVGLESIAAAAEPPKATEPAESSSPDRTGTEWLTDDGQPLVENVVILALHDEANRFRARHGLPKLILDGGCCHIGQKWSVRMAESGNFAHGGGEQIIAWGQQEAKEAIQAWADSPGHRAWLLNRNVRYCGWGCHRSSRGIAYWSGVFRERPVPKK